MGRKVFISALLIGSLALMALGADEDEFLRADRPDKDKGPTEVQFFVFVMDIDSIDGAAQNFTVNVYLRLQWNDKRLVPESGAVRMLPLEKVWNPRILITNKQGLLRKSLPEDVKVYPDGTVMYIQRYVGPLSQPLRLSEFPFDKHKFTIHFVAVGYEPGEVDFVPGKSQTEMDIVGGTMHSEFSLPDWKVLDFKIETRPFEPVPGAKIAGFVFEFTAKRFALYYVWQVIIPLVLIVMMSWGAFWIDPTNAGAQIGVATSSMLTLIAYRFLLGNLLPRLPYMTRLDYFTLGSTVLVFLTLVEVILTSMLARRGHVKAGRRMDRAARIVFPTTFIVLVFLSLVF